MAEDIPKMRDDVEAGKTAVRRFKPLVDVASASGRSVDSLLAMLDEGTLGAFVLMDTQRTAHWSCRIPDPQADPANHERFDGINFEVKLGRNGEPIKVVHPLVIAGVTFVRVYLDRPALFGMLHIPGRAPVVSWRTLRTPGATLRPARMALAWEGGDSMVYREIEARCVTDAFMLWAGVDPGGGGNAWARRNKTKVFEAGVGNPIGLADIYIDEAELGVTHIEAIGEAAEETPSAEVARARRKARTAERDAELWRLAEEIGGKPLLAITSNLALKVHARSSVPCGAPKNVEKVLRAQLRNRQTSK